MEEKSPSKTEEKPFSVLERFRQLKKEKEQDPAPVDKTTPTKTSGTVFQASTSSVNGDFNQRGGFRGRRKRNFNQSSSENPKKRVPANFYIGQKEPDVGITEFIRHGPGFEVIMKHRFTDFQVNEIDKDGQIVRLTSTEIEQDEKKSETLSEEEDPTIISPEQWDSLRKIVDEKLDTTVVIDVTDYPKEKRQQIHKAVKKRFGCHIYSNTLEENDKKVMKIGHATNQANSRFCTWPKDRPEYLHFVLHKENSDITGVISVLTQYTFIKQNRFSYAGVKDKRAVTTQQMCVRRGDKNRFKSCSRLRGIAVGHFCYKWNNIRLGDLAGNRFKIVLRNIKVSDEEVGDAIEQFKTTGFINYFGLQRFGQSIQVPTYSVGKAILKGDWKLAVELILKPRPGEPCYRDVTEARDIWWKTKDAIEALKPLTRKDRTIEGKILVGLQKHGPRAYQNAFDNLARQTVTMYLHSYQSLIWNNVVSRRIKEFGLKVLPGDLVKAHSCETNEDESSSHDRVEDENKYEENIDDSVSEPEDPDKVDFMVQVRALSAEEAETASIFDVLYPLPGTNVRMPDNQVAAWYTELLLQDGHSMDCFKKVNRKYGMAGSYRNMIGVAEDLSWHTLRYSDPDEDLLLSDVEVLRGKPPPVLSPESPYRAVVVEFSLKPCNYATMAIRELTKCETSTSSQASLTNKAREEDLASKKQKLEEEEQKTKCEVEEGKEPDVDTKENDNCDELKKEPKTEDVEEMPPVVQNLGGEVDEEREMNKREAEADNLINKYLESNYY